MIARFWRDFREAFWRAYEAARQDGRGKRCDASGATRRATDEAKAAEAQRRLREALRRHGFGPLAGRES